jgi:adenine-specific DNA glycosylase
MAALRPAAELIGVVETLSRHLTPAPVPTEPLAMILWENIGYLIDDDRRRTLFNAFEAAVGLDARAIAAADDATLLPMAEHGGMRPETRVQRWRTVAQIALERCGGDLAGTLRDLPLAKARALLKTFPVIADAGADKVLLFSGIAARPCLESNGLRSLARLGFFHERGAYGPDYKAGIEVLEATGRADRDWLMRAHQLLRELGKTWCKRGVPLCLACPLDATCAHAEVRSL